MVRNNIKLWPGSSLISWTLVGIYGQIPDKHGGKCVTCYQVVAIRYIIGTIDTAYQTHVTNSPHSARGAKGMVTYIRIMYARLEPVRLRQEARERLVFAGTTSVKEGNK